MSRAIHKMRGGSKPIEISEASSWLNATDLTVYTVSNAGLGAVNNSRVIFIAVFVKDISSFTSVTVGGNSTVKEVENTTGSDVCAIFRVGTDPGGTTGDVVVTCSDQGTLFGMTVIRTINWLSPASPFHTDVDATILALNIPPLGFAIAASGSEAGAVTVTGLTEHFDFNLEGTDYLAGAWDVDMAEETARAIDFVGSDVQMAAASYSL